MAFAARNLHAIGCRHSLEGGWVGAGALGGNICIHAQRVKINKQIHSKLSKPSRP